MEPAKRAKALKFHQLIQENSDRICEAITREHGQTLADAQGELQRGLENVEFATGIAGISKVNIAGMWFPH